MSYKTEQEEFWSGEFCDGYIDRKQGSCDNGGLRSNTALFSKILSRTNYVGSVIEFGANIGLNLQAISILKPEASLTAVEINEKAVKILKEIDKIDVYHSSILDYSPKKTHDLAFVKTVLIHINPEELQCVYGILYKSSKRYICITEYYNPAPVTINYRGHENRLFKRDFAGEMMDKYPDLQLVDYGFVYHRDNNFKQDDITWFLLEKC